MRRIVKFLRSQVEEFLAGGLVAVVGFVAYYWFVLSGAWVYRSGVKMGNTALEYIAEKVPNIGGWNVSGMMGNLVYERNAGDHVFEALVFWGVVFLYFAIRRTIHFCRRLLRRRWEETTGPRAEIPLAANESLINETASLEAPARGASRSMRSLKVFYSIMGDLMWVLTVASFAVLVGLLPKLAAQPVPFFGTVVQALIYLMFPATVLLVIFNMLSGRWPAEGWHRTRNIWVSGLSFFALGAIAFMLFVLNKGETGLPTALVVTVPGSAPFSGTWTFDVDLFAKVGLISAWVFAFIDWWYTKGEEYVATSQGNGAAFVALRQQLAEEQRVNAMLRAQIESMGAAPAAAATNPSLAAPTPDSQQPGFPFKIRPVVLPAVYLKPGEQAPPVSDAPAANAA